MQLLLALTLVLLVALAIIGPARLIAQIEGDRGIAAIAASEDVQVNGIEVNVTGGSGKDARLKGWKLAQRLAWAKLKGPKMSDERIDAMVAAIVVEKEHIGPRRYVATLGVIFDRTKAGQFISAASGSGPHSAPMLVVPVLMSGGVRQVFEVRGPWQRAWAEYQMADSPIDYVRPSGSGGESLVLNAGQPGRRSRIWWRSVLDQFEAADVLIPIARLERQWPGGPVSGTFTTRYGPDNKFLSSFTLNAKDEASVPNMLAEAIRRMDLVYRDALAGGLLKPDPTLASDQNAFDRVMGDLRRSLLGASASGSAADQSSGPAAGPEQTATGPEQAMVATYSVQFASPDAAAVDVALGAIRGVPGVRSAATTSIAIGGTSVMRVTMIGSLDALAGSLRAQGWQVSAGSNAIRISR
ncbi:MAG: heavy-metal-associated domain-containing protein [Novosphingobium sp.]|nr:heavy-metal-associated domain-containing protein [Novosphingobium sp.]